MGRWIACFLILDVPWGFPYSIAEFFVLRKLRVKTTLLTVAALACFALAYRFASHGIRLKDNLCIGLSCAAFVAGALLLMGAFWNGRRRSDEA